MRKRNLLLFRVPYLIYGRVSTEKDEQVSSLENQVDICRNWIEKNGYEWNEQAIVLDNGISGTVLFDRAAMQLVLEKSRNREIKMVIFKSIHRLARDMKDALEIKETLLAHGVRLVTIEEGYDSLYDVKNDMKFEMFSMFAAQYPKTLSVSISGVFSAKVRRGEHVGPVPFGYTLKDKKLVINEDEAPTVRQIFRWYNHDRLGFKTITRLLNEQLEKGMFQNPEKKKNGK
ncbi:recombinase family protein [Heyndrickxia coagulans]|uniref:recombinase family protein n=1 Tax=Heyndrickxia coagulans TaxID=1398 RepID=UPI003462613A